MCLTLIINLIEYSESYSATVHQETVIEGYQCCTSLQGAFESLIFENYMEFILTVGYICVSIYCKNCITIMVMYGLKCLILLRETYLAEIILKVYVCVLKYGPLIVEYFIFRVYITIIYYKLRIFNVSFHKTE